MHRSYLESLKSVEWRRKRISIINRDNCQCTKCANSYYLKKFHRAKIDDIKPDISLLAECNKGDDRFRWHQYQVNFKLKNGNLLDHFINTDIHISSLSSLKGAKILFSVDKVIDSIEAIYSSKDNGNLVWHYARNLEVHHSFYEKGKNPWEYSDDTLITLCPECHKKIHEESDIPMYR